MSVPATEDPLNLLTEWMEWWETDEGPAKMPNALHVRTAIVLLVERGWKPKGWDPQIQQESSG